MSGLCWCKGCDELTALWDFFFENLVTDVWMLSRSLKDGRKVYVIYVYTKLSLHSLLFVYKAKSSPKAI